MERLGLQYLLDIQMKMLSRLLYILVLNLGDRSELEISICQLWHGDIPKGLSVEKLREEKDLEGVSSKVGENLLGVRGECP